MKILLLGKTGQVGWELQRTLAPIGEVTALGRRGRGHPGHRCRPSYRTHILGLQPARSQLSLTIMRLAWHLIERIGVLTAGILHQVEKLIFDAQTKPLLAIKPDWYY